MVKVHEQVVGMNVYFPDSIERVWQVLERRETSTATARARDSRANWETGFSQKQYGDGLTTQKTCVVKLDLK